MNYQGAQEARKNMNVHCDIIRVPKVRAPSFSSLEPMISTKVVKTGNNWEVLVALFCKTYQPIFLEITKRIPNMIAGWSFCILG